MINIEVMPDQISSQISKRLIHSRGRQETLNSNVFSESVLVISPKLIDKKPNSSQQKLVKKLHNKKNYVKEMTRKLVIPENENLDDHIFTSLRLGQNDLLTQT